MSGTSVYTCSDYREEMTLLALRNRLCSDKLSETQRRQIKEEIRRLEEKIGMK